LDKKKKEKRKKNTTGHILDSYLKRRKMNIFILVFQKKGKRKIEMCGD